MCYSVVQIASFDNVRDKVNLYLNSLTFSVGGRSKTLLSRFLTLIHSTKEQDTPMLLVGTKTDLRSDDKEVKKNGGQIITKEMVCCLETGILKHGKGEIMVHNLKLSGYIECSAKLNEGISQVFQQAVRLHTAFKKKKADDAAAQKKGKCVIL